MYKNNFKNLNFQVLTSKFVVKLGLNNDNTTPFHKNKIEKKPHMVKLQKK